MKNYVLPIIGAVFTALLSTLCCLPAFLFLFFGVSGGILTYFTTLEYIRIPMAVLTVILFIYGIKKLNGKIKCECTKGEKVKNYFLAILFFLIVLAILLYPEIIPMFME
ncbi:transporter [Arcobacter arenosus]|uniref:Transporter n=1 Tax=Arcobacter arenosus TaxID=2576037 RepID=A0A5R8XX21_9BACT|nr:transporter [Arcobacter arenosus]TLP35559.1 transporter [Arcobacter arenosus]